MSEEKKDDERLKELEEKFKEVTITPLPYYMTEIMSFPKETEEMIIKTAFEHNCTTGMVIEHYLQDLLSDKIDISKITPEKLECLKVEKPYLLVMKDGKPYGRFSFFGEECNTKKEEKA